MIKVNLILNLLHQKNFMNLTYHPELFYPRIIYIPALHICTTTVPKTYVIDFMGFSTK